MAAFPCPDALIAFSTAPLETRRALLEPCPWDAQNTPQGIDNTLMHHVLDDIAQLVQQGRRALASDHPIVEHQRASIELWLTALEKHRFTLALPESRTVLQSDPNLALTTIPYAAHPGVTPLLILHTQKTTRVATHPIATLDGDTHTATQATPKLAPWQYPGAVTDDLGSEIDKILTPLAEDLGLKPGADHFVPAIAIDAATEVQQIVTIAALLMKKGLAPWI